MKKKKKKKKEKEKEKTYLLAMNSEKLFAVFILYRRGREEFSPGNKVTDARLLAYLIRSIRSVVIIAIHPKKSKAVLLDPRVRFETTIDQAQEADLEKKIATILVTLEMRVTGFLEFGKDAATLLPRGFDESLPILLNKGSRPRSSTKPVFHTFRPHIPPVPIPAGIRSSKREMY
ncbi:hypothetical protein ANN_23094 [Periplaneta americana]|uniref:Uncharacterized protein n=1 Tax=Periplaneta americana TaxID=6978 RepID=A0ABQ8SK88_PERAM|nr:hypothetical protein ANN_23094 [Periplaneta americana]